MGDACPHKVIVMVSAYDALCFQKSIVQPQGVSARRLIPQNVIKNLKSVAPRCCAQGVISRDALVYLHAWCSDTLLLKPRPPAYSFLNHRQSSLRHHDFVGPAWLVPARFRHVDLNPGELEDSGDDDGDDDDAIFALPGQAG